MARRVLAHAWPFWAALAFLAGYEFLLMLVADPDVKIPWQALFLLAVAGVVLTLVAAVLDGRRLERGRRLLVSGTILAIPLGVAVLFWLGAVYAKQGAPLGSFIPVSLVVMDLVFGGLAVAVRGRLGRAALWPVAAGAVGGWAAWVPYVGIMYSA